MEEEIKEGFVIRDDNAAEWALQKIFDEKAELERLKALADSQIAVIMDKVEAAEKRFTSRTEYLKNALEEYMLTVKRKQSKTQESYRLLSGSLILKKPVVKIVKDDTKLLEYVKEHSPEYVKHTEAVDWAGFKKTLTVSGDVVVDSNGEVVSCLDVEEAPGEFMIRDERSET